MVLLLETHRPMQAKGEKKVRFGAGERLGSIPALGGWTVPSTGAKYAQNGERGR